MDLGAYNHMNPSKESFRSLYSTYTYSIEVGDSTYISMKGKGDIPIEGGCILDVLLIPNLFANLLFIYQIFNNGSGKTILFIPNDFEICSLLEP